MTAAAVSDFPCLNSPSFSKDDKLIPERALAFRLCHEEELNDEDVEEANLDILKAYMKKPP